MPIANTNSTSRDARRAELVSEWGRNRNSHQEVLRLYRRYTGNTGELGAGTDVIEEILNAEFKSSEG